MSLITSCPQAERPRERCLAAGADLLSLREIVAILIGTGPRNLGCLGLSEKLLARTGGNHADIHGADETHRERAFFHALECGPGSLTDLPGLGDAARARLLAAFELGRRYAVFRQGHRNQPAASRQDLSGGVPAEYRMEAREWFGFIPEYPSGPGRFCLVERGVRTHVNVDPAELFARVLALRPRGFYLFHNHPSGDLTPSGEDFELTRRARDLAARLGIALLGHCIIGPRGERWIVL